MQSCLLSLSLDYHADVLNHVLCILVFYSKPDLAEKSRHGLNKLLANEVPIEIKPVQPPHFYRLAEAEPKKLFWVRARGYIGKSHSVILVFAHKVLHVLNSNIKMYIICLVLAND